MMMKMVIVMMMMMMKKKELYLMRAETLSPVVNRSNFHHGPLPGALWCYCKSCRLILTSGRIITLDCRDISLSVL